MREASRLSQSYIIAAPSADDCDAQAARLAARAVCSGAEPKPCGKCRDCRKSRRGNTSGYHRCPAHDGR
ncbi:MAG: hypothetical protein V8S72_04620 [Oscillospiraceae bacterium]